jgi:hypothetical protein
MSVTLRHLFSPILRRWCTSSSHRNDDVTNCDEDQCDVGDEIVTKVKEKDESPFTDIENGIFSLAK